MALGDIYFYHGDDTFAHLIQWRTKGPYEHVCVEIKGGYVIEAKWPRIALDDNFGTPAKIYTPSLPDEHKVSAALDWLYEQVGNPYGVTDIAANVVTFFLPNAPFISSAIFNDCSALTAKFLLQAGYAFPDTFKTDERSLCLVSPNDLARSFRLL